MNNLNRWFIKHSGIMSIIYFIITVYLTFYKRINAFISDLLNGSASRINSFLEHQLLVKDLLLFIMFFLLIKYLFSFLRSKQIKIIKAVYYTPNKQLDITERIKKLVESEKRLYFK